MKKIEKQIEFFQTYCLNVKRLSVCTIENRKYGFKDFLKSTDIEQLEDIDNFCIDNWLATQTAKGFRSETINVRLAGLMAMVHFYEERGMEFPNLNEKILKKVKKDPVRRVFYSKDEIDAVLSVADERQWLMISLCFECGFRISELSHLKTTDIRGNRIDFIGKGNKLREVYISDEVKERLERYIAVNNITDYIWESPIKEGYPVTVPHVRAIMGIPFVKLGYTNFYPHALRHSFATNICNNGAPLPVAQKMLGHSSIATTERYVHSFEGRLEEYFMKYSLANAS